MSNTKKFALGVFSINALKLFMSIVGIVLTPFILSLVKQEEYGIYIIVNNFIGYLGLAEFGLSGASQSLISKNNVDGGEERINTFFNNAIIIQSLFAIVMLILGFSLSFFFTDFFNLSGDLAHTSLLLLFISIVSFALNFPSRPLGGVLKGLNDIALNSMIELIYFVLTTVSTIVFLLLDFGIVSLVLAPLVSRFIILPVYFVVIKKRYAFIKVSKKYWSRKAYNEMIGLSMYTFIGSLSARLIYSSDNMIIGKMMSSAAVTPYALTFRLVEFFKERLYSFNITSAPIIGKMLGENKYDEIRLSYMKSQKLVWFASVCGACIIFVFNFSLVVAWVGESNYAGNLVNLMFALYFLLTCVFHSSSIIISASTDVRGISYVRILEALINVGLTILLINEYGYVGVVFATVISSLVTSFWYAPIKCLKILQIPVGYYFRNVLLVIFPACALMIGFSVLVYLYVDLFVVRLILFLLFMTVIIVVSNVVDVSYKNAVKKKLGKYVG